MKDNLKLKPKQKEKEKSSFKCATFCCYNNNKYKNTKYITARTNAFTLLPNKKDLYTVFFILCGIGCNL